MGLETPDAVRRRSLSLDNTAQGIRHSLTVNDADDAFRQVVQFLDDIKRVDDSAAQQAIRMEPEDTGNERWDALLAGVAEYACRRAGLLVPEWACDPGRCLRRSWFVVEDIIGRPTPGLAGLAFESSPRELARRGVYIDATSLESV